MELDRLLRLDPRSRRDLRIGTASSIGAWLLLLVWTLLFAATIDDVIEGRPFGRRLVLLIAILLARAALSATARLALRHGATSLRSHLRPLLLADAIGRRVGSSSTTGSGSDPELIGSGIDDLDAWFTEFVPARTIASTIPLAALAIIAALDPWSVLILLFTGPMLIGLLAVIGRRTKALADRRLTELGWLRSFHLDMVRGIPTLRVFGRAEESAHTIEDISARFGRSTMDVLRTAFQTSLVIEWAATAATALVAVQISYRMVNGDLAFGTALAVLMLTPEFFAPLRHLAAEYHAGQSGSAVLDRIDPSSLATPSPTRGETAGHHVATGSIVLDHVSFGHLGHRAILDGASLQIAPGETVALIGPSGIGKSTLARLILGLAAPTSGRITVDGRDIASIDPQDWHRSITHIAQDPIIISGTVAENIALSDPTASPERIRDAARLARATSFIDGLPDGSATILGEDGFRLSGGQRQRIAIARALLRDAPIVVLDEFTAHLDPETESEVISTMREFLVGRTALLIAHRGASIELADRIVTIVDGMVVEVKGARP